LGLEKVKFTLTVFLKGKRFDLLRIPLRHVSAKLSALPRQFGVNPEPSENRTTFYQITKSCKTFDSYWCTYQLDRFDQFLGLLAWLVVISWEVVLIKFLKLKQRLK